MNEETALAIIYSNTKRKKRTENLLTVAKCFDYLRESYGTQAKVANKTGLSPEMVREFLKVLKLPKEIRNLIRQRKIDKLDVAYRISMLKDREMQITVAKELANLPTHDIRDVIRLTKEHKTISVKDAKDAVLKAKPRDLHVFILDFDESVYRSLLQKAEKMQIKPAQLVKIVVENWLKRKDRGER